MRQSNHSSTCKSRSSEKKKDAENTDLSLRFVSFIGNIWKMQKKRSVCGAVCIVAWIGEVFSVTVNLIWMVYYGAVFELAKLFSSCWVTENRESKALFSCIYLFCCCYCMFFFSFLTNYSTRHEPSACQSWETVGRILGTLGHSCPAPSGEDLQETPTSC